MQPALLVPTVSVCDYGWRRRISIYRLSRLLSCSRPITTQIVLAFSSTDYYMHSRTEIQGVRHSVCPSNCQLSSPPPTMQPITCLSHYVRSVYAYSMLRKAVSDIPVPRHCSDFCNCQCHLFLFAGINTEVNDITLSRLNNGRPTKPTVTHEIITYVLESAPFKFDLECEKTWFEVSYFVLVAFPSPRQNFVQNAQVTSHFASLSFRFQHKTLYAFRFSRDKCLPHAPPTSPARRVLVLCQKYNSWNSSLCNCRQFIVTSPSEVRKFPSVSDFRTSVQVLPLLWDTEFNTHIK